MNTDRYKHWHWHRYKHRNGFPYKYQQYSNIDIYSKEPVKEYFFEMKKRFRKYILKFYPCLSQAHYLTWSYIETQKSQASFCFVCSHIVMSLQTGTDIVSFWYHNSVSMDFGWHFVMALCYNRPPLTFHFVTATLFL